MEFQKRIQPSHENVNGSCLDSDEEVAKMANFLEDDGEISNHVQSIKQQKDHQHATVEEDAIVYVEPLPSILLCPIHFGLLVDPVIARCGHTFCRKCITTSIQKTGAHQCSHDKAFIRTDDLQLLIPNLVVHDTIGTLKIRCRYGCVKNAQGTWEFDPQGCPSVISLQSRKEHEQACPFAIVVCPYNKACPSLRRKDLPNHLEQCQAIPCPHKRVGCPFMGNQTQLQNHLEDCAYEKIKGFFAKNRKKMTNLKKKLKDKEEENKILNNRLKILSSTMEVLSANIETKSGKFEQTLRQVTSALEGTQDQLAEALKEIEFLKRKKNRNIEDVNNDLGLNIEYDPVNLNCKGTFTGHTGPVWGLAFTRDGLLVSASSDTTIKIWDVANFKCKQTLVGHEGIVHAVVVHGNKLCSGSSDKSIRIWDLTKLECIKVIKIHDNTVCSLATANGLLFSGSYTEIKVWDLETYKCIQTLTGHNHWVRALTAIGGFLYSGSYNIVKVWDLKSSPFQCVRTITGQNGSIYCLAVSPEQNKLLSGTYENNINVYELDTLKCIQTLSGHIGAVYTLCISENRFFSGSYDSTIKVWNFSNYKCLQTLVRHSSSVDALVSAGGCIFSGSADASVKVWK